MTDFILSSDLLYFGETRTESNGSISGMTLQNVIDAIPYLELSNAEFCAVYEAMEDGDDVEFNGTIFRRVYRRNQPGGYIVNARGARRARRAVA